MTPQTMIVIRHFEECILETEGGRLYPRERYSERDLDCVLGRSRRFQCATKSLFLHLYPNEMPEDVLIRRILCNLPFHFPILVDSSATPIFEDRAATDDIPAICTVFFWERPCVDAMDPVDRELTALRLRLRDEFFFQLWVMKDGQGAPSRECRQGFVNAARLYAKAVITYPWRKNDEVRAAQEQTLRDIPVAHIYAWPSNETAMSRWLWLECDFYALFDRVLTPYVIMLIASSRDTEDEMTPEDVLNLGPDPDVEVG